MMDDFERNLATLLRSTPSPPAPIDPGEITGVTGRRVRSIAGPVVAVLVVIAVAVTLLVLRRTGDDGPAAKPATTQQPSDLVGSWELADLQGLNGTAHATPTTTLTFRFEPSGIITQGCSTAKATVGVGTLSFEQDFISTTPTGCPNLTVAQSRFLFGQVLTGTATWRISNDELKIEHGLATAVFQRVGPPPTSSATTGAPSPSSTRYLLAGGIGEFVSANATQLAKLKTNGGLTATQAIRKFKAQDSAWRPPRAAVHRYGFFTLEHGATGDHYLRTPAWAIVYPGCASPHLVPHGPHPKPPSGCESWVLLDAHTGDLLLITNGP